MWLSKHLFRLDSFPLLSSCFTDLFPRCRLFVARQRPSSLAHQVQSPTALYSTVLDYYLPILQLFLEFLPCNASPCPSRTKWRSPLTWAASASAPPLTTASSMSATRPRFNDGRTHLLRSKHPRVIDPRTNATGVQRRDAEHRSSGEHRHAQRRHYPFRPLDCIFATSNSHSRPLTFISLNLFCLTTLRDP